MPSFELNVNLLESIFNLIPQAYQFVEYKDNPYRNNNQRRADDNHTCLLYTGENFTLKISDKNRILYSDPEFARQIYPGLNGYGHSRFKHGL